MSWSGYISGSLVRELWKDEVMSHMNAPTGMSTSSESPMRSQLEANASGDASEPSLSEAESLLRQATTVLQQAAQAAWKVRAHEDTRMWLLDRHMTPGQEAVSPFMQRLTLYCGLLALSVKELYSIAPMNPVMAATDSLKVQESESSSPPQGEPFSRSSDFEELYVGRDSAEPPYYSVVLDSSNDAWQRRFDGWECAIAGGGGEYSGWSWTKLTSQYTLRLIYRGKDE